MYTDWRLWLSPKGRINRRPYFFAGLATGGIVEAARLVPEAFLILYLPVMLLAIYVSIALGIKRCHDRGRTGWFLLLNVIPVVCLWPFVELVFLKGAEGPNEYGPDPLGAELPPPAPAPMAS